jgi:cytochrome c peroxidase
MRSFLLLPIIFSFIACNQQPDNSKLLQSRIDSLEKKLATTYKPGFGEFMSNIQIHHAKLWFAGKNQNWELADFEMHEIAETLDAIKEYQTEREESKKVDMLKPSLDAVNDAIEKRDSALFNSSYLLLTNTCNSCHKAVNFGFNVVKVPDTPPFSNHAFK